MQCSVLISCNNQHNLNVPFPEDQVLDAYQKISSGLMDSKKKGKFFIYEDAEWPFICNPEHVISILVRRQTDGQENTQSKEGNGQET